MKIVIAPDSFKETLNAKEVASCIRNGFKKVFNTASIINIPMADGGEGTVQALVDTCEGEIIYTHVHNPLGKKIRAFYGILHEQKTAVIEMATASGLELLHDNEKNPLLTSSYGFGELINDALERGIKKFIFGLGGSATNDAGIGMLQALGVKFLDKHNQEVKQGAQYIHEIISIDDSILKEKFKNTKIEVACDVKNILCGKNGASYTFAKQKGADVEMIKTLDETLLQFSKLCKKKYKTNNEKIEGSGAAGGLGFGLITFLNAQLKSGIDIVIEKVGLEEEIKDATLVITGEGKMDAQSIYGKTPIGVAKLAKKYDKNVIAICGCVDQGYEAVYNHGIDVVFDATPIGSDFKTVKLNAKKNLELTALNVAKCLKMNV